MKSNKLLVLKYLFLCAMIVYAGWTLVSQQITMHKNAQQLAVYEQKIGEQKAKTAALNEKKELIDTPEYMEKLARERSGMIMPDETLFVDSLAN